MTGSGSPRRAANTARAEYDDDDLRASMIGSRSTSRPADPTRSTDGEGGRARRAADRTLSNMDHHGKGIRAADPTRSTDGEGGRARRAADRTLSSKDNDGVAIHAADATRSADGEDGSAHRDAALADKVASIVFKENTSNVRPKPMVGIDVVASVSEDEYLTEEQENATVLGYPGPSRGPTPGLHPRKTGINPVVWQGNFVVPAEAVSEDAEVNRKNMETVEAYNTMTAVLYRKQGYSTRLFSR